MDGVPRYGFGAGSEVNSHDWAEMAAPSVENGQLSSIGHTIKISDHKIVSKLQ